LCLWWRSYPATIRPAIHIRNMSRIQRFWNRDEWKQWHIFVYLDGNVDRLDRHCPEPPASLKKSHT
jgi:hypothetical protein